MTRTLTVDLAARAGQHARIEGWVHNIRRLGGLTFLTIRDRTGLAQAVWEGTGQDDLARESVVQVDGIVREEPRAPGGVEVRAEEIEVLARPEVALAIDISKGEVRARLDTLLDHRGLSLRHPQQRAVVKIAGDLSFAFQAFLQGEGFVAIHTPKIVGTATEGGANLFSVDYLGRPARLAQSPQLYKQIMVGVFERVYEVGPVYRAEPHDTTQHLNEYWSLDVEIGFIRGESELMDLEERLLRAMIGYVSEVSGRDLETLGVRLPEIGRAPRWSFAEAREMLAARGKAVEEDGDLDREAERALCDVAAAETGAPMAFVYGFPQAVRPFYAMPEGDRHTRSFDLLLDGWEVTTGGQRIHDPALLEERLRAKGLDPSAFEAYIETFRLGMPPHGGFAIGLERLTARLLGLANVREASLFPRDSTRLTP